MWPFRRRTRPAFEADAKAAPDLLAGPELIRRTVITVEREWISTTVRRPRSDGLVELAESKQIEGSEL